MKIRLLARAEIEMDESASYYNAQKINLGAQFLIAIEQTCSLISQNPERFHKNSDGFRESPMQRFPFMIIYKVDEESLYILSVFHFRRNPSTKPK